MTKGRDRALPRTAGVLACEFGGVSPPEPPRVWGRHPCLPVHGASLPRVPSPAAPPQGTGGKDAARTVRLEARPTVPARMDAAKHTRTARRNLRHHRSAFAAMSRRNCAPSKLMPATAA